MKIRNGFVSNSSSSSFILIFDKKPESKDELATIMGDCESSTGYSDEYLSSEMVTEIVWRDLSMAGDATDEELKSELSNYYYDWNSSRSVWDMSDEEREKYYAEEDKKDLKRVKDFREEHEGKDIFILGYGDDDGFIGSEMEHGDVFRNVNCMRVSHH